MTRFDVFLKMLLFDGSNFLAFSSDIHADVDFYKVKGYSQSAPEDAIATLFITCYPSV